MTPVKNKLSAILAMEFSFGSVGLVQLSFFAKTLALMLKAGVTITEALTISEESSTGKMKSVLKALTSSVRAGRPLWKAFGEHPKIFSPLFINTTKVGEASGTLPQNLEYIAVQLEKERILRNKVKGAAVYPIVVVAATTGLGIFTLLFVLPKIIPLLKSLNVELPLSTRILIWLGESATQHGAAIVAGLLLFVTIGAWLSRQSFVKPITHWLLLHTPIVKTVVKSANLARFSRTLGTLIQSGVPIHEAMMITKDTTENVYYRSSIEAIAGRVGKGVVLSTSLKEHTVLFPLLFTRMIVVGEESGKIEESLLYFADFYEENLDTATKTLSTAVEPMLLLTIGLVVAFVALSIITPIFKVTGSIQ
jgi:type II secretory pathway component PulF